jgi:hypothetical protein
MCPRHDSIKPGLDALRLHLSVTMREFSRSSRTLSAVPPSVSQHTPSRRAQLPR